MTKAARNADHLNAKDANPNDDYVDEDGCGQRSADAVPAEYNKYVADGEDADKATANVEDTGSSLQQYRPQVAQYRRERCAGANSDVLGW